MFRDCSYSSTTIRDTRGSGRADVFAADALLIPKVVKMQFHLRMVSAIRRAACGRGEQRKNPGTREERNLCVTPDVLFYIDLCAPDSFSLTGSCFFSDEDLLLFASRPPLQRGRSNGHTELFEWKCLSASERASERRGNFIETNAGPGINVLLFLLLLRK